MPEPARIDREQAASPKRQGHLRRLILPSWSERKRLLLVDAKILVAVSYLLALLHWLWPQELRNAAVAYILPTYVLFLGWTFIWHLGLLLVLITGLAVWWRRWRLLAATLPLLLITLGPELRHYLPKSPPPSQGEPFTVMSVNLLFSNRQVDATLACIEAAGPDVLLLQEYSDHWHEILSQRLAPRYPYYRHVVQNSPFGTAIYSRHPLVGDVRTDLDLGGVDVPQIRAVIEIAGRQVAFYNIHVLPPYGLWYTARTRAQLADLLDILRDEPLPVILAGDFNFTDRSANAAALHDAGFVSTHALAGRGRGSTWPVHNWMRYLPGIRLDHIYLRGPLTCRQSGTCESTGSDHRPIISVIGFTE